MNNPGYIIWWGAYVDVKEEILIKGRLADVAQRILETRASARASHGWVMDIYVLNTRAS